MMNPSTSSCAAIALLLASLSSYVELGSSFGPSPRLINSYYSGRRSVLPSSSSSTRLQQGQADAPMSPAPSFWNNTDFDQDEKLHSKKKDDVKPLKMKTDTVDMSSYDSSYKGLTGPSKAGLTLAILASMGLLYTAPNLDSSSLPVVDWDSLGLFASSTWDPLTTQVSNWIHDNSNNGFSIMMGGENIQASLQQFQHAVVDSSQQFQHAVADSSQQLNGFVASASKQTQEMIDQASREVQRILDDSPLVQPKEYYSAEVQGMILHAQDDIQIAMNQMKNSLSSSSGSLPLQDFHFSSYRIQQVLDEQATMAQNNMDRIISQVVLPSLEKTTSSLTMETNKMISQSQSLLEQTRDDMSLTIDRLSNQLQQNDPFVYLPDILTAGKQTLARFSSERQQDMMLMQQNWDDLGSQTQNVVAGIVSGTKSVVNEQADRFVAFQQQQESIMQQQNWVEDIASQTTNMIAGVVTSTKSVVYEQANYIAERFVASKSMMQQTQDLLDTNLFDHATTTASSGGSTVGTHLPSSASDITSAAATATTAASDVSPTTTVETAASTLDKLENLLLNEM